MCKQLIYTFLILFFFSPLAAQQPANPALLPCGTPPGIDPWLREWQQHPEDFVFRSSDTLNVGIQVHLVARNNSTGRFPPERMLDAFCRLNTDFAPAGIRFYFKNDWQEINNTTWYNHSDIPQGIDMMLSNNAPDVLNAYFVGNPAGNAGYNLPYGGVAIANNYANLDQHTWSHEVGHALSLPHTFIGWEGTTYNFSVPTPNLLTYDYTYFHDTLDTTTPAPLDTALVERLDGSNCGIAADLFCDTPPDYLSYRWDCDAQGKSLITLKDQSGATFKVDGTFFMSYSNDVCANRFSDEEIAAMRGNLQTEKVAWLSPGPPEPDVTELPTLLSPAAGTPVAASNIALHWTAVPGATHYLVQVSKLSNYVVKNYDVVVSDTSYTIPSLPANFLYYWRVRPFNYWYTCTEYTGNESFTVLPTSAVNAGPASDGWRCYPSRLLPGQSLTLELPEEWLNKPAECRVFDAAGRLFWQHALTPNTAKIGLQIPCINWPAGVYHLVWANELSSRAAAFLLGDF